MVLLKERIIFFHLKLFNILKRIRMLKNRGLSKITWLCKKKANNPLEKILMIQTFILAKIIESSQKQPDNLSQFQQLCKSMYANTCHTFMSIINLLEALKFPNYMDQTTTLNVPTDMLKPIAGLVRPLYEAVSILKFIGTCTERLNLSESEELECKNEISWLLYYLSLCDAEFQLKWQSVFDQPIRKRDEVKPDHSRIYKIIDQEHAAISKELDDVPFPCRNILIKKKDSSPKDIWKVVVKFFQEKGVQDISYEKRFQIAWNDEYDAFLNEILENLKLGNFTNPWVGDPDEYELKVSPGIALKKLIFDYKSQALHFDAKYLFQNVPCKIKNILNLWRVICLSLPEIINELIELNSEVLDVEAAIKPLNYDFNKLSKEASIWGGKISPLLIKRIMEGY